MGQELCIDIVALPLKNEVHYTMYKFQTEYRLRGSQRLFRVTKQSEPEELISAYHHALPVGYINLQLL